MATLFHRFDHFGASVEGFAVVSIDECIESRFEDDAVACVIAHIRPAFDEQRI